MQLAATVRYGYDEELIFAQQLGTDRVVMRCQAQAAGREAAAGAHRVAMCGLHLAAIELTDLPVAAQPWADAAATAIAAAAVAGIPLWMCEMPAAATMEEALELLPGVIRQAAAAGTQLCLSTGGLQIPALTRLAGAGVRLELVVGQEPFLAAPELPAAVAPQAVTGAAACIRFESAGSILSAARVDVPRCVLALTGAGYSGLLRAGAPAALGPDDDWRPQGVAADLGYLRAMLQSLASGQAVGRAGRS